MINGIIQVEIIAFAAERDDYERLSADFRAFHWLDTDLHDYEHAAKIGFQLRRNGLTVPATDLIIAASAIRAAATLYHIDQHYVGIAEHTDLRARHLRQQETQEQSGGSSGTAAGRVASGEIHG